MIVVTWRSLYLVPVCDVIDFIINLERMAKWCRERTPNDDDLAGECARCFRLKMAVVPYSQHFTCDVAPPSTPIIHISFGNERAVWWRQVSRSHCSVLFFIYHLTFFLSQFSSRSNVFDDFDTYKDCLLCIIYFSWWWSCYGKRGQNFLYDVRIRKLGHLTNLSTRSDDKFVSFFYC